MLFQKRFPGFCKRNDAVNLPETIPVKIRYSLRRAACSSLVGGTMQALWQDVRFGVRMLMKNRLVTLVCIVALALGIGANAAIFSMAEAFLLHPVPFENADRFLMLADRHTDSRGAGFGTVDDVPIAPATYFDWKKQAKSFDRITAYSWDEVNLTGNNEPQKIQAMHV
ncbi:MAG TPA: hypothetical protein VMU69_24660, partial [Bradyrhizobium sp.]|nr:hypothetical protein [Bradyrhizobium sp.]